MPAPYGVQPQTAGVATAAPAFPQPTGQPSFVPQNQPDPRDVLTQLMLASMPNNPRGGSSMFENDIPNQPFVPQLPPGWQPPGQQPLTGFDPTAGGAIQNQPPPVHFRAAPTNIVPPGKSTTRQGFDT